MPSDQPPALPQTVQMTLRGYACKSAFYGPAGIPDDFAVSATLAGSGLNTTSQGYPGTLTLTDTCFAVYNANSSTSPNNLPLLQSLVNQTALDRWNWLLWAFDVAYSGIIAPVLDASVDSIRWEFSRDRCSTRLQSDSWDSWPEQLNHFDPVNTCPDCVQIYDPQISETSHVTSIPKTRLCLESGELVEYPNGSDTFDGCCAVPSPPCTLTVCLYQRTLGGYPYFTSQCNYSAPISGATITLSGGVTASGTTSESGCWTSPQFSVGETATLTVTYGGCSYSQTVGTGNCGTLSLGFCAYSVTLDVSGPESGISVVMSFVYDDSGDVLTYTLVDGTTYLIGTLAITGSIYTFTFCDIRPCSVGVPMVQLLMFTASATGWASACSAPFNPLCGSNTTVTATMYYYANCYANYLCGPAPDGVYPPGNGYWNCCLPPCVPTANADGYYPLTVQVKWQSIAGTFPYSTRSCDLFGTNEGQWITLSLTTDAVTAVGAYAIRTLTWTSGCLPGGTYFTPGIAHAPTTYGSSSVTIVYRCSSQYGGTEGSEIAINYNRFQNAGCEPGGATDCTTTYPAAMSPSAIMCSPVDATINNIVEVGCSGGVCEYNLQIREVSCNPDQLPVITQPVVPPFGG